MLVENTKILSEKGKGINFLLDTSAILYFEMLWKSSGVSIFEVLIGLPDVNYFICNDVVTELISGERGLTPNQKLFKVLLNHILTAKSAIDNSWKENRFLVYEGGEVKYIVLNKISAVDYAQVLLCQNHEELTLVSNDRKLLKSAAQVVYGRRVWGIPVMLENLLKKYPYNERLNTLKEVADKLFLKKSAFSNHAGA